MSVGASPRPAQHDSRGGQVTRHQSHVSSCLFALAWSVALGGCGYTTRPGLASHLKTVYVKPFENKIDMTQLTAGDERFPIYRHQMEVDLTKEIVNRYQFTGLLRPISRERADCRVEGELIGFHRDALRYDASQQIEEWRLNVVVNLRFFDQTVQTAGTPEVPLWEESGFTGDTTYFTLGSRAESEADALNRAITDLARRIVERTVEDW